MTTIEFDPVRFKEQQRANWDGLSGGWLSVVEVFERGAGAVTARLLSLGGVRPGLAVLDVGCGIGEPALSAAAAVGPSGRVVGVDLAPEMITLARRRADGLDNVEFVVGDLESLDLAAGSFDVVLSRWGLMFAPSRAAAFGSLLTVLRPGGVLAASTWGFPGAVPMMSLGFQALGRCLELGPPPPGTPGPFSMTDPVQVASELREAGFTGVDVTEFEVPFVLSSAEEYVEFSKAVTPPAIRRQLRERFGNDEDPRPWALVAEAVERYRQPDGRVALPSTALCLQATKPAG